jgi:transcriptional regulator with XRE-family HTH domain
MMRRHAGRHGARPGQAHPWHWTRPLDSPPAGGTYRDAVATAPGVDRARFARFVARALDNAHDRGMTDKDIAAATGIGTSTFHRWQRGEFATAPAVDKVKRFCLGLGESVDDAMTALGVRGGAPRGGPEPPLPPEVKVILRALADPNVPDQDKLVIREMLRMLANQARARRPARERRDERDAG